MARHSPDLPAADRFRAVLELETRALEARQQQACKGTCNERAFRCAGSVEICSFAGTSRLERPPAEARRVAVVRLCVALWEKVG